MSTIVTRTGKGSALTYAEMDANFTNLNTDKVESSALAAYETTVHAAATYQPKSANLDEYAAVNPTAAGLALLDDADAAAQRTTLGLGNAATGTIGSTVQAYDAATAKTNQDQTWTGSQRGTVGVANTASYAMDQYNNFTTTLSTSQTIAFTGIAAGQSGNILWTVTGTPTISKNTYVKVSSSLLTTLGTAGTYWLSYYSPDGTNVYLSSTGILT